MKNKKHILFILLLFFSLFSSAQDTLSNSYIPIYSVGKNYLLTTIYGSSIRGPLTHETEGEIVIFNKKTNTTETFKKYEIKEMRAINVKELYMAPKFDDNYYTNFYMATENSLPFKKQSLNSTSHYFFFNNVNYFFNEHWGISSNVLLFLPISIGLKCSFKLSDDLYIGGNAYAFGLPMENEGFVNPLFGGSARVTKGTNEKNFSIGGGAMAFRILDSTQLSYRTTKYTPAYFISIAYAKRFHKHASFSAENIIFPQANLNMTGLSIRWLRDPNDHWNFGCYALYLGNITKLNTKSSIVPIPYFSYSTFFN